MKAKLHYDNKRLTGIQVNRQMEEYTEENRPGLYLEKKLLSEDAAVIVLTRTTESAVRLMMTGFSHRKYCVRNERL